jgi:ComF family protein
MCTGTVAGRCVLCGVAGAAYGLCVGCLSDLPRRSGPLTGDIEGLCVRALVPYAYAFPLDQLILRFKFHRDLAVGKVLGELLEYEVGNYLHKFSADRPTRIVPVPLGRWRYLLRGFNQAAVLAAPIARACLLPLDANSVRRIRGTGHQSRLGGAERRRNLHGAFATRARFDGVHIVIVDDVVTTGATARELARVLRGAGAVSITLVALAASGQR